MTKAYSRTGLGAVLVAVGVTCFLLVSWVALAADVGDNRAVIVYEVGDPDFQRDALNMQKFLIAAGWKATNIKVLPLPAKATVPPGTNESLISTAMSMQFAGPPNNTALKFFFYSGHGTRFNGDQSPLDETGANGQTADNIDEGLGVIDSDDSFPSWTPYAGPKVIIYSTCYAGGMFDGTSDPVPSSPYIFAAAKRDQEAIIRTGFGYDFTIVVLKGLLASGADATPNGGNGDGEVTLSELRNYVTNNYPPPWATEPNQPMETFLSTISLDGVVVAKVVPNALNPATPLSPLFGRLGCTSTGTGGTGGVPAISTWVLIAIGTTLLGMGTWVIRRHKPQDAQAVA